MTEPCCALWFLPSPLPTRVTGQAVSWGGNGDSTLFLWTSGSLRATLQSDSEHRQLPCCELPTERFRLFAAKRLHRMLKIENSMKVIWKSLLRVKMPFETQAYS